MIDYSRPANYKPAKKPLATDRARIEYVKPEPTRRETPGRVLREHGETVNLNTLRAQMIANENAAAARARIARLRTRG